MQEPKTFVIWLLALPVRLLAIAVLLVAGFLLVGSQSLRSGSLHKQIEGLPAAFRPELLDLARPWVASLVALILIILVAHPVYAWLRPFGWLVPVSAVAAATLLTVNAPTLFQHGGTVTAATWIRVFTAMFLIILLAKFFLLHRNATRAYATEVTPVPAYLSSAFRSTFLPQPLSPLPSQEQVVARLEGLITDRRSGRLVPLEGRQGAGKSFLVNYLKHVWAVDKSKPVVVVVDVWQQQTEADLQTAILEALFRERCYLVRLGWLYVPASFLFARWIAALRGLRAGLELRLRGSKANVELNLDIPGLRWQAHFERVTARIAARGRRGTMVVLDEIDRATPLVTQSALTVARRSVDVPGVIVLIPYVPSFIRYKAFNPFQSVLPDLGSSIDAILYEERFGRGELAGDPQDPIAVALQELRSQPVINAGFRVANAERDLSLPMVGQRLGLSTFTNAPGWFRGRLQERFEEKYLGVPGLRLRTPTPEDLAAMVTGFESLKPLVRQLKPPETVTWDKELQEAVRTGLEKWQDTSPMIGPPLRVLEGELYGVLDQAIISILKTDLQLSPQDVAALLIAAYDATAIIHE